MKIQHETLHGYTEAIFAAAGCEPQEATCVAHHLVGANLAGHDSHGVILIPRYVQWLKEGKVVANQQPELVLDAENMAVLDGKRGLGQRIGEIAVQVGIDKSASGVSVIALRNVGHLGRIGDWPLMAAETGRLSVHFVNTSGAGRLVAPFGGIERRLSANPFAVGIPVENGDHLILDISTCTIAEGKIRVALNSGVQVPPGCIVDAEGDPTTDPRVFYDAPGSILPIAGHKGYGLSVIVEMLAGALTGGGCTNVANKDRLANGMLSIYIEPSTLIDRQEFFAEVDRFVEFVKSSCTIDEDGQILMPGDIERMRHQQRAAEGVKIDEETWRQIHETASQLGVAEGMPQP